MKPVNFKKWMGVAVISFILTIVFGIIGAISSGASMVGMMYETGTDIGHFFSSDIINNDMMNNSFFGNDMMNDDDNDSMMSGNWSFGFGDKEKSTCTFSIERSQGSEAGDVSGNCTTTTTDSNN